MNKIIIGGSGRAGTTLLTRLFLDQGLRAGGQDALSGIDDFSKGGLEQTLTDSLELLSDDSVDLIKSPWIYLICEEHQFNAEAVSFVIVPIRNARMSSMSRTINEIANMLMHGHTDLALGMVNGKYAGASTYSIRHLEQDNLINQSIVQLTYWCSVKEIPLILVPFPLFFDDPCRLLKVFSPVINHYSLSNDSILEWISLNYKPLQLMANAFEPIDAELVKVLDRVISKDIPTDGLTFIKAVEKLILRYRSEADSLRARLNKLESTSLQFAIKSRLHYIKSRFIGKH